MKKLPKKIKYFEENYECEERSWNNFRLAKDESEAKKIQFFYESAMTRRRTYIYHGLWYAVLGNTGENFKIYDPSGDLSLGCVCGFYIEDKDVFKVSHFAPSGLRSGTELLNIINKISNTIFVFCVTEDLAPMLEKLGFINPSFCQTIEQPFGGEIVTKVVFINKRAFEERFEEIKALFEEYVDYD